MIRLILVVTFLITFLVLSIPILIAEWMIGKFNQDLKDRSSLAVVKWAFRSILWLAGTNVIVLGEDNIPQDTPVVYVGNHRSYFDIIMTYMRVPRLTGYVAKKEMLRWPLLRNWMRNVHCLFLDRKDVKQGLKTILAAIEKVQSGISICIFPEGTRNDVNDTFLPFHEGSFKIAEKGNVPIVPMSIVNAADIWEDHIPHMKKTTVVLAYCPPVYMSELDKSVRKNIGSYVCDIISREYFKNKAAYFGR